MKTALFTNFSNEPFTGYWDGKGKTFQPGQSVYMPDYLARHFAKHLANRELLKIGKERETSPKFPEQVPAFMEMFNKAFREDNDEDMGSEKDDLDTIIDAANKNRRKRSEAPTEPAAQAAPAKDDPGVQTVVPPDFDGEDDEESFQNKPVESQP